LDNQDPRSTRLEKIRVALARGFGVDDAGPTIVGPSHHHRIELAVEGHADHRALVNVRGKREAAREARIRDDERAGFQRLETRRAERDGVKLSAAHRTASLRTDPGDVKGRFDPERSCRGPQTADRIAVVQAFL
jgi:hypothetical protein